MYILPVYFDIILHKINEKSPNKRKPKYSNEYYLDFIFKILNDVVSWHSLKRLFNFKHKNHFKTIYNKFLLWTKLEIFEDAFNQSIKYQNNRRNNEDVSILCIDSTNIINKYGSELVAYNGADKKKRITKINIVCDNDQRILCINAMEGNEHDIKGVLPCIETIKKTFKYKKIKLLGDKAYISKDIRSKLKKHKIDLITYSKINSKTHNSPSEIKLLKNRSKVECVINKIKKYNRVQIRRDRKKDTYLTFIYIACITCMI